MRRLENAQIVVAKFIGMEHYASAVTWIGDPRTPDIIDRYLILKNNGVDVYDLSKRESAIRRDAGIEVYNPET